MPMQIRHQAMQHVITDDVAKTLPRNGKEKHNSTGRGSPEGLLAAGAIQHVELGKAIRAHSVGKHGAHVVRCAAVVAAAGQRLLQR